MSKSVFHGGKAHCGGGVSGELEIGRRDAISVLAGRQKQRILKKKMSGLEVVGGVQGL